MDIGVVLQTTPPARQVIDLARKADSHGFLTFGRLIVTFCGKNRSLYIAKFLPKLKT